MTITIKFIKNIHRVFPLKLNVCAVTSVVIGKAMLKALCTSDFSALFHLPQMGGTENSERYLYILDESDKIRS